MSTFHLQIVTPDRKVFEGDAQKIILRTVNGDVCILPHHIDFAIPLGIGQAMVTDADGNTRQAACNSGMLSVSNNEVRVIAVTFEWADEIDLERAKRAEELAKEQLQTLKRENQNFTLAEAKLKRALVRIQTKSM
ncbi:MAG: ATP synthase F1 subunit epsilon [Clostridia bacterium]|nr:ATP synthase F1 subunit epsilon [Clostridia bacterium]